MSKNGKTRKLNPNSTSHIINDYDLLHSVAFWGVAILLFLPPYFRGLFFAPEQQKAFIFAVIVFWTVFLWKWFSGEKKLLSRPLDYFVLSIPLVYILATFGAVNYSLSVDETLKVTMYFLVYWSVVQLVRDNQDAARILHVIYISSLGVALFGLMTSTGLINIRDGFLDGRIYSTLQYPNALASFLTAALMLGMYLLWRTNIVTNNKGLTKWFCERKLIEYFFVAGNFLLMSVIWGTGSNGGFVVLVLVSTIFILLAPVVHKIDLFVHFMYVSIFAYLFMSKFLAAVKDKHFGFAWLWIILGLVLVVACYVIVVKYLKKYADKENILIIALLLVFIIASVGLYAAVQDNFSVVKILKVNSASHRIYFIQDAVKMIIERPLLGWGGGGWQEAYRAYQSYLYNSNQVHSYQLQVVLETGILGLLAMGGMWVTFGVAAVRNRFKKQFGDQQMLVWSCTIAALGIFIHALIDFDLSYGSLALVLWTLFALVRRFDDVGHDVGLDRAVKEKENKNIKVKAHIWSLISVTSLSLVFIFFVFSFISASGLARQSIALLKAGRLPEGVSYMQRAVSDNPLKSDYYITLAQMYRYTGDMDSAFNAYEKALSRSKYNAFIRTELAGLALKQGNWDKAIELAEEAVTLNPFIIQQYEFASNVYREAGIEQLKRGRVKQARVYFTKAAEMPDRISQLYSNIDENKRKLTLSFEPSSKVFLNSGVCKYFIKDFNGAVIALNKAANEQKIRSEALLWLSLVFEKQGKSAEAVKYLSEVKNNFPGMLKDYNQLGSLPFVS